MFRSFKSLALGVLERLKTVDGAGSGLDADLLDGVQGASFATSSDLTTHAALTSAHGSTSAPTASRIVARDASGGGIFQLLKVTDADGEINYFTVAALTGNVFTAGTITAGSGEFLVGVTGKLQLGSTAGTSGLLNFAAGTTAAGGIYFGSDTTLYRSAADTLKTDDNLHVVGDVTLIGVTNQIISTPTSGFVTYLEIFAGPYSGSSPETAAVGLRLASYDESANGYLACWSTLGGTGTFERWRTLNAGNFLIGLTAASGTDKLQVDSPISPKSYTVATLPTAGTARRFAYASNGRKPGEGAAAGTGIIVFDDGTAWRSVADGTTIAA